MIIDSNYISWMKGSRLDPLFVRILLNAYQKFSKQIMIDLTKFYYEPHKYGFAHLNLISKEYAIQDFFKERVEQYIRDYMFIDVFSDYLNKKGFNVSSPRDNPEYNDATKNKYLINKDYEKQFGFEIIIQKNDKKIGCKFFDIDNNEFTKLINRYSVSEISIIDWYSSNVISEEEREERTKNIKGNINIQSIEEFSSFWLGDEGHSYLLFVDSVIRDYQETIGISSLPKLTAPVLFNLRLSEERVVLKTLPKDIKYFYNIEKRKNVDTEFGYNIIDSSNFLRQEDKDRTDKIEERSKKLLAESGICENYVNRKLYKALIGKKDFAKSFLTSEYLYKQYNKNDIFDYTAIVSGYLKSIEQLLTEVVFFFADQGKRIKWNGKRKPDGTRPNSSVYDPVNKCTKILLTSNEVEYVNTTMGSLNKFVEEYKNDLFILNDVTYKDTIIDCLECYRIECRNDSFHTHNNYDWDRVETIRHNTLLLYIMLLGGFNLFDDELFRTRFGIVENDRLERIYYWFRKNEIYTFQVKFSSEDHYRLVTRAPETCFPSFNNHGLLDDGFIIELIPNGDDVDKVINYEISRGSIPEEIWYQSCGEWLPIEYE